MITFLLLALLVLAGTLGWVFRRASQVVLLERGGELVSTRRWRLQRGDWVILFLGFGLSFLIASLRLVPVGYALVEFNYLTRHYSVSEEGLTLVVPFLYTTHLYPLRRQEYTMSSQPGEGQKKKDDSLWSPTREGLQVGVDLTVWYRIRPDALVAVHRKLGPTFEEKVIRPAIRSIVRLVISSHTVKEIYSGARLDLQQEIHRRLKDLLERDGFVVEEVILRDVHFPPDFARAIEEKQIAQQEAERMKYVLEKERLEKERKKIEAEGTAQAIEIVSRALKKNPRYIQYLYVDKLSDKVKVVISDQGTLLDLRALLGDERNR